MDGALTPKAGGDGKAVVPVPVPAGIDAGAGAATSSVRVARKTTTLPAVVPASAADLPTAATTTPGVVSNGSADGEDEDDEQVERFYALLDNIRAMRGAYGSGNGTGALDDGSIDTGGGGTRVLKRLRGSEPPWRPAFRLEDFEEPTPTPSSSSAVMAPCAKKRTRGQEEADGDGDGEGSGGARPDVAAAVVRVRLDSGTAKSV